LIRGLLTGFSEQEITNVGYGYLEYKFPLKEQEMNGTLDEIYKEALIKGFSQLIVIDGNNREHTIKLR
jgi:hypothetical protein